MHHFAQNHSNPFPMLAAAGVGDLAFSSSAAFVTDVSRIADELGWRARQDLDDIFDSVIDAPG